MRWRSAIRRSLPSPWHHADEAELLKRYRSVHADFPHQSTLDQFYDEEQFEAYRQLGVHVAEGTFAPALMTDNPYPPTIENWFRQLAGQIRKACSIVGAWTSKIGAPIVLLALVCDWGHELKLIRCAAAFLIGKASRRYL
jgi:hypothetical protein